MDRIVAKDIYKDLCELIPDAKCELNYSNMYELIIAVILSAQCKDARVNEITPILFSKYPRVEDLAQANISDVAKIIKPLGFYSTKSKNIVECAKGIVDRFHSIVPDTLDDLVTLPGVGRKTASVVLAEGYKLPAIPVDTHVQRVSFRLGLSESNNVRVTEEALKSLYEKSIWGDVHTRILLFGRYYCTSRNPKCSECKFKDICKYYKANK